MINVSLKYYTAQINKQSIYVLKQSCLTSYNKKLDQKHITTEILCYIPNGKYICHFYGSTEPSDNEIQVYNFWPNEARME